MVDGEVAKFDEELKKSSHEATRELQQLEESKIREIQEEYLKSIKPKDEESTNESAIKELFNKFFGN